MSSSEQKPSGFTVTDRRSFASDPGAESPPPAESAPPAAGTTPAAPSGEATRKEAAALPEVDFGTFVLSLGSSAIMHLGEFQHPDSGKVEKDLAMAKHTIDILSMLQARTKGNLNAQEEQLIESLLYDLRLRYVNASKA
jgi:hypothetical protein